MTLEKNPSDVDALDLVFRMVHSIKGMAASLDFQGCADLAHRMEDRLGGYRERGCVDDADGLPLLFRGLSRLEVMVEEVRAGRTPSPDPELSDALAAPPEELGEAALVRPAAPAGEELADAERADVTPAPESPPKKA